MSASTDSTESSTLGPRDAALEETSEPPPPDGLTQDTAFEILSNERRRHILHCLSQRGETVSLRELSMQLAAWENRISIEEVTYEQRRRVYTALRQVHLPKLVEANVIEYDSRKAVAELTEEASELDVYLEVVPHDEIPWSTYYTGLGFLTCVLLSGAAVEIFPLHLLPDLVWAILVSLLFTSSALAHRYRERQMRLGSDGKPPI